MSTDAQIPQVLSGHSDSPTIRGFQIFNYRSFGSDGVRVDPIAKINVFIGKNNAGKSNVLRFLRQLGKCLGKPGSDRKWSRDPHDVPHGEQGPPRFSLILEEQSFWSAYREPQSQHGQAPTPEFSLGEATKDDGGVILQMRLEPGPYPGSTAQSPFRAMNRQDLAILAGSQDLHRSQTELLTLCRQIADNVASYFADIFRQPRYIPHFRQVRNEAADPTTESDEVTGSRIIAELAERQHPILGKEAEREAFVKIQDFVRSLMGEEHLTIEVPHDKSDIYVNLHGGRLPLESFGTGLHELIIICSALATTSRKLVLIEEPELHLHPDLQRKLMDFMKGTDNTYFVSTHSNVFMDSDPAVCVHHVRHDGRGTTIEHVRTDRAVYLLLDDLGYHASDLLQSNGIVWVEGPSDRVYLNRWLELCGCDWKEGLHYSIMFYGGKLLSHLSAEAGNSGADLIKLLRLNRNAFVLIDRDSPRGSDRLRETKKRVIGELGKESCWVTKGVEIENYLTKETLDRFLETRLPGNSLSPEKKFGDTIEDYLPGKRRSKASKSRYDSDKVGYARKIVPHIVEADLAQLDLRRRLDELVREIERWNPASLVKSAVESTSERAR
ncbi:AAA family ATPase [Candidatus Poribacteria bacterium]|nr:AAA family ATPase [Candidatus Poribacteria bacterium]